MGFKSWIYREGATRSFWVLETTAAFIDFSLDPCTLQNRAERMAYVRGFFDAEGGLPRSRDARMYLQLAQKDLRRITAIRSVLIRQGFRCGVIHNPSRKVDADYWRFYVRAVSHQRFLDDVRSWHPLKRSLMSSRRRE